MSAKKTDLATLIAVWSEEEINRLELSFLHKMFRCDSESAVDMTIAFARYMSEQGLDSDNYPIFLKLLQLPNHWVADALLGSAKPETFFRPVQPNQFIISSCFKMLQAWRPGEIYPGSLLVIVGLMRSTYEQPHDGYRIYPLTVTDVNNLGKHLDEEQDQTEALNQTILHLLDRIASLADPGVRAPTEKQMADVANQANNIRGKFLDRTKHLREAIPSELLKRGDYRKNEIPPSTSQSSSQKAGRQSAKA